MKKSIYLVASLLALNLTLVFGQPATPIPASQPPSTFAERLAAVNARAAAEQANAPALTKFNLDFPGGTPAQLVKAIEKAMGKPLNAIIPTEDADLQIPPLKMNDVVVPQLFAALHAAGSKQVQVQNMPGGSYHYRTLSYGFSTSDNTVTDSSIWYFKADKLDETPVAPIQKVCRFFQLSAYLNRGFTVDDITTAIQTGWKMAGETPNPELNYHKETKLLIAFGEPAKLNTIQYVLDSLPASSISQNELNIMQNHISDLQREVELLDKRRQEAELRLNKLSTQSPAPVASPIEEKTGK
jgi:hypothetical protein